MSEQNDGGPAFPVQEGLISGSTKEVPPSSGLSRLDWFAGMAMQGLLACGERHDASTSSVLSADAYKIADAMLKAREVKP